MRLLKILLLLVAASAFSQETPPVMVQDTTFFTKVDSLYREDQFYFSVTYNLLQHKPAKFSLNGFSTGLSLGFLRDMPINKKRTYAIAAGLGVSYNKYHNNLRVTENNGDYNYEILENVGYSKNKLEQLFLELPIEFRWRNSTFESHKFYRVYTGFKIRYLLLDKTKFVGDQTIVVSNNSDFNQFQFGPYVALGFNTWNFHAYYGLTPLFKSAAVNGEKIDTKTLNFGLMFYIL
ncbi:porin family protein [Flavobacterium sp.]|uniref:porin family protein n=1 Tax=Flavobacterium sp. TaxID=239 RepID=UPI002603751C|nr:porin family protein [Flavobacterium sp.]